MIYTINNCIRAFGYTNFDRLIEDIGSVDGLREYVIANGYADIAVAEDTELLLVDVNGKTWHTGCYGAVIEPPKPYLCFTSTGDSTVGIRQEGTPSASANKVIQYKLNNGRWQTWDLSAISLSDGDKMYLKSDDDISMAESTSIYKNFTMTGSIAASGNIMSLLNFIDIVPNNGFTNLFLNCTSLITTPELPATTLQMSCYSNMFNGCTSLTTAPVLPATTLAYGCYSNMFNGCASLTTAPVLPATTLKTSCYEGMFYNCESLTQAPVLPATTLETFCYAKMFQGCTKLTTPPTLPATTLQMSCYSNMFNGCTSLTTAPELPATELAQSCYHAMFNSCTSLTTAPELPATILAKSCYSFMFQSCTSLTQAPELPATTLAEECYNFMFQSCTNLNHVKAMFTTDLSTGSYLNYWLENVSATGTFIKSKDATWTNEQAGIPTGWTVQVEGGVTPEPGPERDYLCFTSTGDSTVAMTQEGTPNTSANKVIQYKLNNGQWQTWDLSAVTLADGDKMYLKSDDEIPMAENQYTIYKYFVMTGSIAASGNIMSLLNFSDTLPEYAFHYLFKDCTSLTTTPVLPATTLAWGCYASMFKGCTSLTTAPVLPATTLVESCYSNMFNGCTSLTTAPELPATTLAQSCYRYMFAGCTSLTTAPELPATTLATSCYYDMFLGCTSLTQAPALPATTLEYDCYEEMFRGCTSLTQAPELHATQLVNNCYYHMFDGCTNLNYVKAMFTGIADFSVDYWLNNVSTTGTFVKNASATWTNADAGIPTGWTVQTASPDK